MKKKPLNLIILLILLVGINSCKKKEKVSPISTTSQCLENKHFEGKYVGTNSFQHDTIEIVFNQMSESCEPIYTIKNFAHSYNLTASNCTHLVDQDYIITQNKVLYTNSTIVDNVWSNDGIHNDNDISIYACNNNQLNFKKLN